MISVTGNWSGRQEQDTAILQRITATEEAALSELYDRYASVLFNLGMHILRSVEATEDLVHDVFIHVWNRPDSYNPVEGTIYTWLVSLMHKRSLERLRARSPHHHQHHGGGSTPALLIDPRRSGAESSIGPREEVDAVLNAMKNIPQDQQQAMALAYYEGLSQTEIARRLNTSTSDVRSRLHKGIQAMNSLLPGEE